MEEDNLFGKSKNVLNASEENLNSGRNALRETLLFLEKTDLKSFNELPEIQKFSLITMMGAAVLNRLHSKSRNLVLSIEPPKMKQINDLLRDSGIDPEELTPQDYLSKSAPLIEERENKIRQEKREEWFRGELQNNPSIQMIFLGAIALYDVLKPENFPQIGFVEENQEIKIDSSEQSFKTDSNIVSQTNESEDTNLDIEEEIDNFDEESEVSQESKVDELIRKGALIYFYECYILELINSIKSRSITTTKFNAYAKSNLKTFYNIAENNLENEENALIEHFAKTFNIPFYKSIVIQTLSPFYENLFIWGLENKQIKEILNVLGASCIDEKNNYYSFNDPKELRSMTGIFNSFMQVLDTTVNPTKRSKAVLTPNGIVTEFFKNYGVSIDTKKEMPYIQKLAYYRKKYYEDLYESSYFDKDVYEIDDKGNRILEKVKSEEDFISNENEIVTKSNPNELKIISSDAKDTIELEETGFTDNVLEIGMDTLAKSIKDEENSLRKIVDDGFNDESSNRHIDVLNKITKHLIKKFNVNENELSIAVKNILASENFQNYFDFVLELFVEFVHDNNIKINDVSTRYFFDINNFWIDFIVSDKGLFKYIKGYIPKAINYKINKENTDDIIYEYAILTSILTNVLNAELKDKSIDIKFENLERIEFSLNQKNNQQELQNEEKLTKNEKLNEAIKFLQNQDLNKKEYKDLLDTLLKDQDGNHYSNGKVMIVYKRFNGNQYKFDDKGNRLPGSYNFTILGSNGEAWRLVICEYTDSNNNKSIKKVHLTRAEVLSSDTQSETLRRALIN